MIKPSMKKIALAGLALLGSLISGTKAFADVNINIQPPPGSIKGEIGPIINNALIIVFAVAALLVLVYLIIGAFQWIVSGGDKEAVGKARARITHALVGFLILALAFVIINVVGNISGIDFLNLRLPKLGQ